MPHFRRMPPRVILRMAEKSGGSTSTISIKRLTNCVTNDYETKKQLKHRHQIKLRRAVEHASLAAHQQEPDLVCREPRKDFLNGSSDQATLSTHNSNMIR